MPESVGFYIAQVDQDGLVIEADISLDLPAGKPLQQCHWFSDSTSAQARIRHGVRRAAAGEKQLFKVPLQFSLDSTTVQSTVIMDRLPVALGSSTQVVICVFQFETPPQGNVEATTEESFRLLVEGVRDYAIFLLDVTGHIRTWNAGAERAKGYTASEAIGKHFSMFYTPEDRTNGKPLRLLKLAVQLGRIEDEGWRVRKDGTHFWADVILTALYSDSGELRGFAKVTRDLTERRRLADARDEALRASQAKSAFLANMSHELRTPLNAIIGYAELVQEELRGADLPKVLEDVRKIDFSSKHLLSIISDVLDLSRIEAGRLELNIQPVDVGDVIRDIVDTARPLASRNNNTVTVIGDREIGVISTDRVRLRQILYNLFSNAAKFTSNGTITVTTKRQFHNGMPQLYISIQDTGVGVPPEQIARLFERFFQVEGSAHSRSGGTGLGLAISRLITDTLGGDINVASEVGKGSTFTLWLPAPMVLE